MTKEELEKEAIKFAVDYPTNYGKGYKHKDLRIAYLAAAEPREKRIAELEKEKAELIAVERMSLYSQMSDQLVKAKEIIENLVKFDGTYKDDEEFQRKSELYDKMWEEAEQFLKGIEK